MEESGREIAVPTIEQLVQVNRRMIEKDGGSFLYPDNIKNRSSLDYVLRAMTWRVFGKVLFPTMKEKAAALGYEIVSAHVFHDGNKRTGMHASWEFLRANSIDIVLDPTIEDIAVGIATGGATRSDLLEWLHNHQ